MPKFTTIASYRDIPIAELARAKLDSEGIPCHLLNKHHIGVNWLYSQALGGVQLQVLSEDAAEARRILDADESSSLEAEDLDFPELDETDYCESCGSSNLEVIDYKRISGALILLTQLWFLFWGRKYRCKDCGHKMKIHR